MYEACFITWWGHKDKSRLTFIERIKIRLPKNGYVYIQKDSLKFAYVNGWLYDCNNKLEPLNVGTNCSAEQIFKLWEAMKCL